MTLLLIESLFNLREVSSVLIECLSILLRIDPFIISRNASLTRPDVMAVCFQFFVNVPENPKISECLLPTFKDYIVRGLSPVHHGKIGVNMNGFTQSLSEEEYRQVMLKWLSKAVELIQMSSQRQKDDPLILVFPSLISLIKVSLRILSPILSCWIGPLPSGVIDAIFPSLESILVREDDVAIFEVIYTLAKLIIGRWKDSKGSDFSSIRSDFSMVFP
jgi:hypothetical protein